MAHTTRAALDTTPELDKDASIHISTMEIQPNDPALQSQYDSIPGQENPVVVSPYLTTPHLLDLRTLDLPSQLLATVLTYLQPLTPSYATTPYPLAFNWSDLLTIRLPRLIKSHPPALIDTVWPSRTTTTFFAVVFLSTRNPGIDSQLLGELDRESHAEAMASGGLLKYWFGSPDEERRNLATCIWRSPEDAIKGGRGPWHRKARDAAGGMYQIFTFGRMWLRLRRDGVEGVSWEFEELKT